MGHLDPLILVIEDRRLDRSLQELLRMPAEKLVEGILACDVQGEALASPPGSPPHLTQARDRPGEGDADGRVQLADIDTQLERVRRDNRQQLAGHQASLDLAALLGRVAGPVGRNPLRQLRTAQLLEPYAGEPLDQLNPASAPQEADRPHSLAD